VSSARIPDHRFFRPGPGRQTTSSAAGPAAGPASAGRCGQARQRDLLRTNGPQKSFELFESFSDEKNTGIISVITVAELSTGAALSPLKDAQKKDR